jgi:hypothetical protein
MWGICGILSARATHEKGNSSIESIEDEHTNTLLDIPGDHSLFRVFLRVFPSLVKLNESLKNNLKKD